MGQMEWVYVILVQICGIENIIIGLHYPLSLWLAQRDILRKQAIYR